MGWQCGAGHDGLCGQCIGASLHQFADIIHIGSFDGIWAKSIEGNDDHA
jgi:hypothetical protein